MATAVLMISGKDPLEEFGGGHCSYVRAHARAAVAAGYEPHIFGLGSDEGVVETDYGFVHRGRAAWAPPRGPGMGVRGQSVPFHAGALARSVEEFGLSHSGDLLLHSFSVWSSAGAMARRTMARQGLHVVHVVSGYTSYLHELIARDAAMTPEHGFRNRLWERGELLFTRLFTNRHERKGFRDADLILYNYESARAILEEAHHPPAAFLRLPYTSESAFTRAAFNPSACRDQPLAAIPRIVSVSRHDARKGLNLLLHALARIDAEGRDFTARLVGGGSLLDAHRRLARTLDLQGVELTGFVDDVMPELSAADIFVLPSLEEGSGSMSLIEAMQAGRAIVASSCDGIPEDVTDGHDALLVAPGDVADLANAISRLLGDPVLRRRLGREARATFERRFTVGAFVGALGAAYASLGFPPD